MIICFRDFRHLVKFRYSEKATIICNNLPDVFDWYIIYACYLFFSYVSDKWEITSNHCGPFRMSGLSISGLFLVKSTHMQELAGTAPLSRSPSRPNAVWSQLFVAIIFPSKRNGTTAAVALAAAAAEVRTTDGRSRPGDRRRPAPVFSLLILF